ncbi:MAG: IS66 family transposase [Prolixibacteraceae bacterium]|nr:IS66 family transposase [Prolixibacteraceae bacterium]
MEKLQKTVIVLAEKVDSLTKENKNLQKRLAKYETPKNSNNSSIPPSKDENRPKRTSLREKSGLKAGGQKGRKGNTLKMVEVPDSILKYNATYCKCCGESLDNIPAEFKSKRQVYDIPKIEIKITEHQIYTKHCKCGRVNEGTYPQAVKSPVSYGSNIESLIGYFHTRQYIPFKRMKEIFADVFHAPISEGGIHYILDRLTAKAQPAYDLIKERLQSNTKYAIGSDETGMKVCGDKHWAWTWQNEEATFITITDNRGQKSIDQTFKNGFENSVLVHDCWASHFNTNAITHQICIAHLLRDLNYLNELYKHKWSIAVKLLFQIALIKEKKMDITDYYIHDARIAQIENRLDYLINYGLPDKKEELVRFQNRLKKYRDYILTFLYRPEVPPDNNASERAIRNVKVKQKVSGQFRSTNGAFRFAVLRSITDTVIKNKLNVLNSLRIISNLETDL